MIVKNNYINVEKLDLLNDKQIRKLNVFWDPSEEDIIVVKNYTDYLNNNYTFDLYQIKKVFIKAIEVNKEKRILYRGEKLYKIDFKVIPVIPEENRDKDYYKFITDPDYNFNDEIIINIDSCFPLPNYQLMYDALTNVEGINDIYIQQNLNDCTYFINGEYYTGQSCVQALFSAFIKLF